VSGTAGRNDVKPFTGINMLAATDAIAAAV
jgi:hypothetical protein